MQNAKVDKCIEDVAYLPSWTLPKTAPELLLTILCWLKPEEIPLTECLKDTVDRVIPLWKEGIAPAIKAGKKVLIAAHGNSLRALIKYLDNLSEEDILQVNIPTARPLVYELDENLKPIRSYYLGNQAEIEAAMAAVKNQGKAK